jgi:hypothetical protein
MIKDFNAVLDTANGLGDIFEVVKAAVHQIIGEVRGGLMLGLADLGNHPQGFLGALFPVGTNIILMNKIPLIRIKETTPELYKPYVFHVLLHEYLHSLGHLDEGIVRKKVHEISSEAFGEDHLATKIAANIMPYFPNLVYPDAAWQPEDPTIDLVENFDRSSVNYIA